MRNFSKIVLSVLAASTVHLPIFCEEAEPFTSEAFTAVTQDTALQPQFIQVCRPQPKPPRNKRHLSIWRLWWNTFKYGIGTTLTLGGIAAIPASLAGAAGLISGIPNEYKSGCLIVTMVSPLLIYVGSKVVQNSYDSCRDEMVESYFNICDPNQV